MNLVLLVSGLLLSLLLMRMGKRERRIALAAVDATVRDSALFLDRKNGCAFQATTICLLPVIPLWLERPFPPILAALGFSVLTFSLGMGLKWILDRRERGTSPIPVALARRLASAEVVLFVGSLGAISCSYLLLSLWWNA
jgi:hypothetical protein